MLSAGRIALSLDSAIVVSADPSVMILFLPTCSEVGCPVAQQRSNGLSGARFFATEEAPDISLLTDLRLRLILQGKSPRSSIGDGIPGRLGVRLGVNVARGKGVRGDR